MHGLPRDLNLRRLESIAYNEVLAAGPDGRSRFVKERGRKVRTPQSSVPDNVREGGFKLTRRKVPQKTYRLKPAFERAPGKGEKVR